MRLSAAQHKILIRFFKRGKQSHRTTLGFQISAKRPWFNLPRSPEGTITYLNIPAQKMQNISSSSWVLVRKRPKRRYKQEQKQTSSRSCPSASYRYAYFDLFRQNICCPAY